MVCGCIHRESRSRYDDWYKYECQCSHEDLIPKPDGSISPDASFTLPSALS